MLSGINDFSILFLSILLEALPFLMLGALASALIEIYVTPGWIASKIKGATLVKYLMVGLIGLALPICECAIVPVMRRLVNKGMPVGLAVTFMLSVPILNPIVLFSTYYAFAGNISVVLERAILGYVVAIISGLIISKISGIDFLKPYADKENQNGKNNFCACASEDDNCASDFDDSHDHNFDGEHDHSHDHDIEPAFRPRGFKLIQTIISHTSDEFITVGALLIMGASISAMLQVLVPRSVMLNISSNSETSSLVMMLFAFILSICSEADAFIAASFINQLPMVSIMAFLVFGPMLDIKNILMLNSAFKPKFVIKLSLVITIVCFAIVTLSGNLLNV